MSLLLDVKDKNQELQKAVVAFSEKGCGMVMYHRGEGIACEIEQLGSDPDELGILDNESPDHGIWIWKGYFRYWQDYEGEWDVNVTTKEWCQLTELEWELLKKNRDPFDAPYLEAAVNAPIRHGDFFQQEFRKKQAVADSYIAPKVTTCSKCSGAVVGNQCSQCGFSETAL